MKKSCLYTGGAFPALIAVISMFFTLRLTGIGGSLLSAVILTMVILVGIFATFLFSWALSKTVLKGVASSFTLELPPYRKPKTLQLLTRSLLDRTLFVLGRAVMVAAPAGLVIWVLANVTVGDTSLLMHCANFLAPLGNLMGLDGIILMAFVLGFPANEIVIPLIIMGYMATGTLTDALSLESLRVLLVNNGWTLLTAINTLIFILFHFPCSTTMLTIKKETQSVKWTLLSFFLPLATGIGLCMLTTLFWRLLGLG